MKAMSTCMDSCNNFCYMFLNLVGEMGEFASKVAKAIRKENVEIEEKDILYHADRFNYPEFDDELQKEAGDILWQLSGLCSDMGWNLEDIAEQNLAKLASRKERNVIDGEGDNR